MKDCHCQVAAFAIGLPIGRFWQGRTRARGRRAMRPGAPTGAVWRPPNANGDPRRAERRQGIAVSEPVRSIPIAAIAPSKPIAIGIPYAARDRSASTQPRLFNDV